MKVTDYIVQFLNSKGVKCVFELSGGMIMQLLDSFYLDGRIKIVSIHHEQTAAFAADAVGRVTGIPGVAIATSGPGATNLMTGIGSCYFDSSPAVFITGQVNQHEQKGNKNIRQLGFQETDIVKMVTPITKLAIRITSADQVAEALEKAFKTAISGRPGPVVIDIPMDIFRSPIDSKLPVADNNFSHNAVADEMVDNLIKDFKNAQRPMILAGGGINASGARSLFRKLVNKMQVPVVSSLLGVDILPYGDPMHVGMIGTYGNRWANISLYESDCLLVLGSRLDIRQTGADTQSFKGDKIIYHVDCEQDEINNRVEGCIAINTDLKELIEKLNASLTTSLPYKADWMGYIRSLQEKWPDTNELPGIRGINPNSFIKALSVSMPDCKAYVADVGQHQMWAAQSLRLQEGQRFITSGGMGAMGFALPAAIGISVLDTSKKVCVIAGDAGFQLNIQELETIVRNKLPIKIIVVNNGCHGMTRQFQETYFGGRYQSTIWGYSAPQFAKVAEAYGIKSLAVTEDSEIPAALQALNNSDEPFLIDLKIDTFTNAYPKMAFGLPMSEMEPYAKPMEMEGT